MIRAAWINVETGIVENIILVTEADLSHPGVKPIPIVTDTQGFEIFLPLKIGNSKWTSDLGFTDLNGDPINLTLPPGPDKPKK